MTRWVLATSASVVAAIQSAIARCSVGLNRAAIFAMSSPNGPNAAASCASSCWLSALWGGMFLLYAVVRVVIIYSTSVSRAVSISEIPGIVAIGICLIASRQAGKRLEALANERLRESGGSAAKNPG